MLPPDLVIGVVTAAATLALTILFAYLNGLKLVDVGVSLNRLTLRQLMIGFFLGFLLVALNTMIMYLAGHVRWVPSLQINLSEIIIMFIIYFSLSCREELSFRGYPLFRLESFWGLWAAQLITAGFFALEHIIGGANWGQALTGILAGSLLFGMAALATRSLALPIGLHAAWNFGDWLRGGKDTGGMLTPIVEAGYEEQVQIIGTISFVIVSGLAMLVFWRHYRIFKKDSDHLEQQQIRNPEIPV